MEFLRIEQVNNGFLVYVEDIRNGPGYTGDRWVFGSDTAPAALGEFIANWGQRVMDERNEKATTSDE